MVNKSREYGADQVARHYLRHAPPTAPSLAEAGEIVRRAGRHRRGGRAAALSAATVVVLAVAVVAYVGSLGLRDDDQPSAASRHSASTAISSGPSDRIGPLITATWQLSEIKIKKADTSVPSAKVNFHFAVPPGPGSASYMLLKEGKCISTAVRITPTELEVISKMVDNLLTNCGPMLSQDQQVLVAQFLSGTVSWRVDGDLLILQNPFGDELEFARHA